jgi:hypothetical protein
MPSPSCLSTHRPCHASALRRVEIRNVATRLVLCQRRKASHSVWTLWFPSLLIPGLRSSCFSTTLLVPRLHGPSRVQTQLVQANAAARDHTRKLRLLIRYASITTSMLRTFRDICGIVVDKVEMGRFIPSTSDSPANLHSTNCSKLTIIYHSGLVQQARSGRSFTPLRTINKKIRTQKSVTAACVLKCVQSCEKQAARVLPHHTPPPTLTPGR